MRDEVQRNALPVKKIKIKRAHLQLENSADNQNNNSCGDNNQSGGKVKFERIKGYGRWYLKPE